MRITVSTAMRARDVSRPRPGQIAGAEAAAEASGLPAIPLAAATRPRRDGTSREVTASSSAAPPATGAGRRAIEPSTAGRRPATAKTTAGQRTGTRGAGTGAAADRLQPDRGAQRGRTVPERPGTQRQGQAQDRGGESARPQRREPGSPGDAPAPRRAPAGREGAEPAARETAAGETPDGTGGTAPRRPVRKRTRTRRGRDSSQG